MNHVCNGYSMRLLVTTLLAGSVFFCPHATHASQEVVINEIAWAGTQAESTDEWIELFNPGSVSVDITGWTLAATDGTPSIALTGSIPAGGYFLIERTDDNAVADVTAQKITSFGSGLSNSGETLELKNASGVLIDSTPAGAWVAGSASPLYASMERVSATAPGSDASNWASNSTSMRSGTDAGGNPINGTPGSPNSASSAIPASDTTPPPAPLTCETSNVTPTSATLTWTLSEPDTSDIANFSLINTATSESILIASNERTHTLSARIPATAYEYTLQSIDAAGNASSSVTCSFTTASTPPATPIALLINEFMPRPADGEPEWVELYNPTSTTIPLAGISIKDGTGNVIKALTGEITAQGYLQITLSSAVLNNTGDIVVLTDGTNIFDQVSYGTWDDGDIADNAPVPPQGSTIGRSISQADTGHDGDDFAITLSPTPGAINTFAPTPSPTPGTPGSLRINEVMSNPATGEQEWVEIFALTTPLTLSGFSLHDSTGRIASIPTTILTENNPFITIELSSSKLNNTGDSVSVKDALETTIASMVYGSNETAAKIPSQGQSIAYAQAGTNDRERYRVTTTVTKSMPNTITQPITSGGGGGATASPQALVRLPSPPPSIIINEIYPMPTEDEEEWVELYNPTTTDIPLGGWTLVDGSGKTTQLAGTIPAGGYQVQYGIKGNLNDAGDIITLKNTSSDSVSSVAYGSWNDGNTKDNAPTASRGQSIAYRDTAWILTTPTPGMQNTSAAPSTEDTPVYINELFMNPVGKDDTEWIELYNPTQRTVLLTEWKLRDASGKTYAFKKPFDAILPAAYLVIPMSESGITLNNKEEALELIGAQGQSQRVAYATSDSESYAFARTLTGTWQWTTTPTQGGANILTSPTPDTSTTCEVNAHGVMGIPVSVDCSDVADELGTSSFHIDFGDGGASENIITAEHLYTEPGIYSVVISATLNNQKVAIQTNTITVTATILQPPVISEFLPNPTGSDSEEWIELFNPNADNLPLDDYFLDDAEGGSKAFRLTGLDIPPGAYLTIPRTISKISLNNDEDSVRVLDTAMRVIQRVPYDTTREGVSIALTPSNAYAPTSTPTPGAMNRIIDNPPSSKKTTNRIVTVTTAQQVLNLDDEQVRVEATVVVPPGALGSQYFYTTDPALQIYSYRKLFPQLAVGDRITITGIASETNGEARVKINSTDDIRVIQAGAAPSPTEISIEDISPELLSRFVKVSALILQAQSNRITIGSDGAEIAIPVKKDWFSTPPREGDRATVTGVLQGTSSGFRIVPLSASDITIEQGVTHALAPDTRRNNLSQTIGIIAAGALGVTSGLFIMRRK